MAKRETYSDIERPYGAFLERAPQSFVVTGGERIAPGGDDAGAQDGGGAGTIAPSGGGQVAGTPVVSEQSMSDLWIDNEIRSKNWKPKKLGFYIDGQTGYAEFSNVFVSGPISATSGTVGGWEISATRIYSGNVILDSSLQQILLGSATAPGTGTGIFIGKDGSDHEFRAGNPSGAYLWWNGSSLTLNSSVISTGTGNVSVDADGNAVFKSVQIGGSTVQYLVSDSGIFSFGDGSDGNADFDGVNTFAFATYSSNVYTLTRDVYLADITVRTGITVNAGSYRVFGTGTATLEGTGIIMRDGNAGADGSDGFQGGGGAGGAGGAALADGYLKGSVAGTDGGAGGNDGGSQYGTASPGDNTSDGTNTTNSLGNNGSAGGDGGDGGDSAFGWSSGAVGGTAGTPGTSAAANVKLIANWHLATLLDVGSTGATVKYGNSANPTGGAGGGGGGYGGSPPHWGGAGGGGGGAGSAGGILAIYVRNIVVGASAKISVVGGNGGNGGKAGSPKGGGVGGGAGGGGGGGGGNGGVVILVYNTLQNSGTITVAAGTGGTAGNASGGTAGGSAGTDGTAGSDGTAGTIHQFEISL